MSNPTSSPGTFHDFHDRVVLITGGTSGMGLATARLLLERGAHVVITGRDQDRLDRAAERLTGSPSTPGGRLLTVRADVAVRAGLDRLTATIRDRHGRLDGVFANAGVGIFQRGCDVTEQDFDHTVDVNFKGVFFTIQQALPLLDAAGGGSVVINASWTLHRGMAEAPVYAATKAAVHNLARTLSSDLAPRGIRVNSVSPGYIVTEMFEALIPDDPAVYEGIRARIPLGRLGRAEDVTEAVAFLLSPASSYITAQDLAVDGGLVNALPA
ncbi:SDR family NAD(P)-dependent oxidoreductase [Kitasatospora sp. NPDC048239]|uniref:SDR family NAD(P)-dependent oxidoreductase n=1 Tax=Kitasatospora sp. NPDC048239 TaxID=3364046 RepID=UPI00371A3C90